MTVNLAPLILVPTTVSVAPTETELATFDTRFTDILTIQVYHNEVGQTLSGVVYRRLTDSLTWAPTALTDFASIAQGASVVADMDVRGTGEVKITGTFSGAGGDVVIAARRRGI